MWIGICLDASASNESVGYLRWTVSHQKLPVNSFLEILEVTIRCYDRSLSTVPLRNADLPYMLSLLGNNRINLLQRFPEYRLKIEVRLYRGHPTFSPFLLEIAPWRR